MKNTQKNTDNNLKVNDIVTVIEKENKFYNQSGKLKEVVVADNTIYGIGNITYRVVDFNRKDKVCFVFPITFLKKQLKE